MRVLFTSTRGAGHVQPLLPYARALVERGHDVLVAAPAEVGETLRQAGLPHAPFAHPGNDVLKPIWARFRGASEAEMMAIAASEIFAGANARAALPMLQETMRSFRPEVVVRDSVEFAALVASAALGVRCTRVAVHSVSFEESLPPLVEGPIAALRESVGLASDAGASLRDEAVFSSFPASLDVLPSGTRMRSPFRARVVEEPPSSAPGAWAEAADPRPLIYITFGSLLGGLPEYRATYRNSLDAVAELPVRALLTTGRDIEPGALGTVPANVHVEQWIPQRNVLPRAAALVCHGGSGTLLGGLAAGLPLVVIGMGADQPHNGRLIAKAGAGLALTKPDVSELRAAIQSVLGSPEHRLQAQRLAREIAEMPTIEEAVVRLLTPG